MNGYSALARHRAQHAIGASKTRFFTPRRIAIAGLLGVGAYALLSRSRHRVLDADDPAHQMRAFQQHFGNLR